MTQRLGCTQSKLRLSSIHLVGVIAGCASLTAKESRYASETSLVVLSEQPAYHFRNPSSSTHAFRCLPETALRRAQLSGLMSSYAKLSLARGSSMFKLEAATGGHASLTTLLGRLHCFSIISIIVLAVRTHDDRYRILYAIETALFRRQTAFTAALRHILSTDSSTLTFGCG